MKQKLGILTALILSLAVAGSTFAATAKPKQNQTTAPAKTAMMTKTAKAKPKSGKKTKKSGTAKSAKSTRASGKTPPAKK